MIDVQTILQQGSFFVEEFHRIAQGVRGCLKVLYFEVTPLTKEIFGGSMVLIPIANEGKDVFQSVGLIWNRREVVAPSKRIYGKHVDNMAKRQRRWKLDKTSLNVIRNFMLCNALII